MKIKSFGQKELYLIQILNKVSNKTAIVAFLSFVSSYLFILGNKINDSILKIHLPLSNARNQFKVDFSLNNGAENIRYSFFFFLNEIPTFKFD
jgi:hypothetical protein